MDFGIREIYVPNDGKWDIDIVAVHGLNGHVDKTWTAKNSICWLNDSEFLPRYIKNARVMLWGYNANTHSSKNRPAGSNRILDHAYTLVAQLESDRKSVESQEKPIIFICHSLGGLVVKRALAYSAGLTTPHVSHLRSIYTCTYGILFLGTPHDGSDRARLCKKLLKLASITAPKALLQFQIDLVRSLERGSETVQNISDQFAPHIPNFRIFFFWEQEKMKLKFRREYIVDEASAAPIIPTTERAGILADHREMCRFDDNTSPGFLSVIGALQRYCEDAPNVVHGRILKSSREIEEMRLQEAREILRSIPKSVLQCEGQVEETVHE